MYKRLELTRLEGLGFTQDDLAFMQSSYRESIGALAQLAGDLVIVTGMTDLGATYSAGWVSINGELLPIAAGVKTTNIIVTETVTQAAFADGLSRDVYYIKVAQLANVGGNPIANFKRLRSLKQLDNDLLTEVTNRTNGDNTNAANIALKVSKAGDNMTGALAMGTNKITGLGNGTNAQDAVTKAQLDAAVSAIVNGSPAALDTLIELAAAMGNDANFATTVTNAIAGKVAKTGDTMSGNLTIPAGSAGGHAVNKTQMDAADAGVAATAAAATASEAVTRAAADNLRVLKTGDTMSGPLVVPGVNTNNYVSLKKKLSIGAWNMVGSYTKLVAHGLTQSKIIGVEILLIRDDGERISFHSRVGNSYQVTAAEILMYTSSGSDYDNTLFNDPAMDRGIILIEYEP